MSRPVTRSDVRKMQRRFIRRLVRLMRAHKCHRKMRHVFTAAADQ